MTDTNEEMMENVNQTGAQMESPDSLNIQDLMAFKEIIDLASNRAAFKPAEMMYVGHAYQRLSTFIDKVKAHLEQVEQQKNQINTVEGE